MMMNEKEQWLALLDALENVRAMAEDHRSGAPSSLMVENGICDNVQDVIVCAMSCADVTSMLDAIFPTWEEYSGNVLWPVPAFTYDNPGDEYNCIEDLWVGEYGDARMRLLNHCIEYCKTVGNIHDQN